MQRERKTRLYHLLLGFTMRNVEENLVDSPPLRARLSAKDRTTGMKTKTRGRQKEAQREEQRNKMFTDADTDEQRADIYAGRMTDC